MIIKLIKALTFLFLIIFPTGVLFRIKILPSVQVVPQDLIVLAICILVIINMIHTRTLGYFGKFYMLQVGFLLIGLASLGINYLYHSDISIVPASMYALRYFFYIHLLVAITLFQKFEYLKKMMIWSGGAFVVLGFVQFIFFNSLRPLFYLGWDDHLYRLFSSFLDPNFSGLFIVLYLFILLKDVLFRSYRDSYVNLILAFFSGLAILITYSRTALVALVSGLVLLGVLKRKLLILVAVLALVGAVVFAVSDVTVEGLNPFRTRSTSERIKSMREAVAIFIDSPTYGSGFNAYRHVLVRYGFREIHGAVNSNADAGTDNSYLFVLATTGIFGLSIFVLGYYALLSKVFYCAGKSKMLFVSYCAIFCVGSFFVNALFYMPILSWFYLSMIFFMRRKSQGV